MMDEDIYTSIEQYLAGELTPEEKKAFEDRIKSDPDFAEKAEVYRSLSKNLRSKFSREQDEQQLRESLSAISKAEITEKSGKVISLKWYHWAAAASVALIAAFWFYTTTSLPRYSEYADHGTLNITERGDDTPIHQAQDAFNSGNYAEAIERFNDLLKVYPDNTELQLYKGIALLELDRTAEAESVFNVIKELNTVYRDKAIWYLALSALKQKDYNKCESILKQLPADSEYHNKAREILERL